MVRKFLPHVIAAIMVAYSVILLALVAADLKRTTALLGLVGVGE